jgi:hypothetical protein
MILGSFRVAHCSYCFFYTAGYTYVCSRPWIISICTVNIFTLQPTIVLEMFLSVISFIQKEKGRVQLSFNFTAPCKDTRESSDLDYKVIYSSSVNLGTIRFLSMFISFVR